jgi:hypothetical protein
MNRQSILKLVHLIGSACFVLSSLYISVWVLLRGIESWWVIVSLSGYSALVVLLLISLYLFAIFRGIARTQKIRIEHPWTTSPYYLVFYCVSPYLGALAGGLASIGAGRVSHHLLLIAVGCFWATFIVWIIVDPLMGLTELLLPSGRNHRRKRLAHAKALRQEERLANQRLLAELEAQYRQQRVSWSQSLGPYAEKLAALRISGEAAGRQGETEAVDIGLKAWQLGGADCMRMLHSMAMEICGKAQHETETIDYISIWWDGIGNWRNNWLEGGAELFTKKGGLPCVT